MGKKKKKKYLEAEFLKFFLKCQTVRSSVSPNKILSVQKEMHHFRGFHIFFIKEAHSVSFEKFYLVMFYRERNRIRVLHTNFSKSGNSSKFSQS
jgi:hypothetical protein